MEKNEVKQSYTKGGETAGQAVPLGVRSTEDYESFRERLRNISKEASEKVYKLSLIEEFEPLKGHESTHEISRIYPHTIRRKKDGYEYKESKDSNAYKQVFVNGSHELKQRLIANQWIPNIFDMDFKDLDVDHDNQHRDDNHIENLIVCPHAYNLKNRCKFTTKRTSVDKIPDDAIVVDHYGKHKLENYFFCNDVFYILKQTKKGPKPEILTIKEKEGTGRKYVNVRDVNKKSVQLFYSVFKREI